MRHLESYGRIDKGKLKIHGLEKFNEALSSLPDGRVRVRVERIYSKRSTMQNSYYWGVVIHEFIEGAIEMWGEKISPEQAHEILKARCNGKDVTIKETGEIITIPQSTRNLTTTDYMTFIESCRKLVGEYFGRYIPEPGEQLKID